VTPRIDHRSVQTPVRQQGNRRTCVAFATSAAHEWMCGDAPDLSEESAVWSAKKFDPWPDTDATTVHAALTGIRSDGQATSEDWPYGQPLWNAGPPAPASNPDRRRRPGDWRQIGTDLANIEAALGASAVILTVAMQPTIWRDAAHDGHVDHDESAPTAGAHAVLGVGIARDDHGVDGQDWVMIKNSWSERWGEDGYGYLSAGYLDRHLLAAHALEAA